MVGKKEFLEDLSRDLVAEIPMESPLVRWGLWALSSVGVIMLIMAGVQSFRPGYASQLLNFRFLIESLLAIGTLATGGLLLFRMSVPGLEISKGQFLGAFSLFIGFISFILYGHFVEPSLPASMLGKRPFCFYEVLVWSWLPIGALVYLMRKTYTFIGPRRAALIGVTGASIPMALMQVACMYDPYHALTHHIFPVIYVAFACAAMAFAYSRR